MQSQIHFGRLYPADLILVNSLTSQGFAGCVVDLGCAVCAREIKRKKERRQGSSIVNLEI